MPQKTTDWHDKFQKDIMDNYCFVSGLFWIQTCSRILSPALKISAILLMINGFLGRALFLVAYPFFAEHPVCRMSSCLLPRRA